jgi:ADP-ribose pyrophosphatase
MEFNICCAGSQIGIIRTKIILDAITVGPNPITPNEYDNDDDNISEDSTKKLYIPEFKDISADLKEIIDFVIDFFLVYKKKDERVIGKLISEACGILRIDCVSSVYEMLSSWDILQHGGSLPGWFNDDSSTNPYIDRIVSKENIKKFKIYRELNHHFHDMAITIPTAKIVLDNDRDLPTGGKWADPKEYTEELSKEIFQRLSHCGPIKSELHFGLLYPINPIENTSKIGRGLLGKYGPNHAADPLVTRFDPESGKLQMVAIQRDDTFQWAMPGGMVEPGDTVSLTLKKEFKEEARNVKDTDTEKLVNTKLDQLFDKGNIIYKGYVYDPRNTNWSWIETTCVHFHMSDDYLLNNLTLNGGSDAVKAKWLDIDENNDEFSNLYASHKLIILNGLKEFKSGLKEFKSVKA